MPATSLPERDSITVSRAIDRAQEQLEASADPGTRAVWEHILEALESVLDLRVEVLHVIACHECADGRHED